GPELCHDPGHLASVLQHPLQEPERSSGDQGDPGRDALNTREGWVMSRLRSAITASVVCAAILWVAVAGCNFQSGQQSSQQRKAPMTLFIGVDVSGSFKHDYDNAMIFLAHYIYGHLHELGGLAKPQALFVASTGGKKSGEPKSFHPFHASEREDIAEITTDLRHWFATSYTPSDLTS